MTAPDASSELRPKNEQEMWEMSHLVTDSKLSPVQPARHWEMLLFLADLPQAAPHWGVPAAGAEGTQQELSNYPLLS